MSFFYKSVTFMGKNWWHLEVKVVVFCQLKNVRDQWMRYAPCYIFMYMILYPSRLVVQQLIPSKSIWKPGLYDKLYSFNRKALVEWNFSPQLFQQFLNRKVIRNLAGMADNQHSKQRPMHLQIEKLC